LTAEDDDSGVERTEYRLNGSGDWLTYSGPVLINQEGSNLLEYRSVDKAGNVEPVRSFEVSIDKTKPTLSLQLDPSEIWPANHKMVKVNATVDASDEGSGLASVVLTSIASSEPGTEGDIDAQIGTDAKSFFLKAEKNRTYTVTYTAADQAGNLTTGSATVRVPHDQSGK
jgi:endo-alpha-N-acetylgalactosaminidase